MSDDHRPRAGDQVEVLKVIATNDRIFYTIDFDDDLVARLTARNDYKSHTIETMTRWQYQAITGTGEARKFFERGATS